MNGRLWPMADPRVRLAYVEAMTALVDPRWVFGVITPPRRGYRAACRRRVCPALDDIRRLILLTWRTLAEA